MTIHQFRGGWSDDELLELSRFRSVLSLPGRSIEMLDIGIGESGDPWAAFCDREGDVLIHIARIGGKYYCEGKALASGSAAPAETISHALRRAQRLA
jgi:hypothetical protein